MCLPSNNTVAYCLCDKIWTGFTCELPNPCASNPCQNNGECTPTWSTPGNAQYRCKCMNGFSDTNCEQNNMLCTATTCSNGGTCYFNPSTQTAKCMCTQLYTGQYCEISFNLCYDTVNPKCLNMGTCVIRPDQYPYYQCICAPGFFGPNCELRVTTSTASRSTTSQAVTSSSGCFDKSLACPYYASNQYCRNYYFLNGISILKYCPKSCNMCSATTTPITNQCVDTQYSCVIWGALKYCNQLPDPYICRKSCNLC